MKEKIQRSDFQCRSCGKTRAEQFCASAHQRNKPAAAGNFEFAEDCVEMLFHHRQTQAGVVSDLLITPPFAGKPRNFLFAPGESNKMRQTVARCRPRG